MSGQLRHTAATLPTPRLVKLLGADARLPANDGDLTEQDLREIDAEFAAEQFHQDNDARALQLQCDAQVRSEWTAR